MNERFWNGLQNGGHQDPGDGFVENGIADVDHVDDDLRPQDVEDVRRNPSPKVDEELLDLNGSDR